MTRFSNGLKNSGSGSENGAEARERERLAELYEDCDDRFAFYCRIYRLRHSMGVMWEEVGIDPGLLFEESEALSYGRC